MLQKAASLAEEDIIIAILDEKINNKKY